MINLKKLDKTITPFYLIIDLFMIGLVLINLSWLIFDALFGIQFFQTALGAISSPFTQWYSTKVHPNFLSYDLIFVAIYLAEFLFSWFIGIITQRYQRWFYYPFIHWYDILGCIPIGSFRFLRVFRIISIGLRLRRMGVLDFSKMPFYNMFFQGYNVIVEEVSDRVVVNVINGIQKELKEGQDALQQQVLTEVLIPQQQILVDASLKHIGRTATRLLQKNRTELHRYINALISAALANNKELSRLNWLPLVGSTVNNQLDNSISDIVTQVTEQIINDLASQGMKNLAGEISDSLLRDIAEQGFFEQEEGIEIVEHILEIVKKQVQVQRWRENKPTT